MFKMTPELRDSINARIKALTPPHLTRQRDAIMMPYCFTEANCKDGFPLYDGEDFPILQGGGTDGKYLYFAHATWVKDNVQTAIIGKYDPATGELLATSEEMPIDHANDITYNPKTGMLIVVHNAPNRQLISFVNPETLEYLGTKDIGQEIYCMSYNEKRDQYAVGKSGGMDFAILDADFNTVADHIAVNTRYTTQGMESDDDYLYFVLHHRHCIMKYDWEGHFIDYITIDHEGDEPENLMFVNGRLYIGFNMWNGQKLDTPMVYRAELEAK